jgi:prepilin-type N-terminal cleavage/methylation domain-containing protein
MPAISHPAATRRGFSLMEMLVSISVIGILSAIAIPAISRTDRAARGEAANQIVTGINRAISSYRQCGSEITINANSSSGADEASVMALLTTADAGVVGSPFLVGTSWPSVESSDTETYRVQWNGRFFVVVPRGSSGTGLIVNRL